MTGGDEKACPFCAERIRAQARLCRFCGSDLERQIPGAVSPEITEEKVVQARSGVFDGVKLGCGMFIVLPLLILTGLIVLFLFLAGIGSTI